MYLEYKGKTYSFFYMKTFEYFGGTSKIERWNFQGIEMNRYIDNDNGWWVTEDVRSNIHIDDDSLNDLVEVYWQKIRENKLKRIINE